MTEIALGIVVAVVGLVLFLAGLFALQRASMWWSWKRDRKKGRRSFGERKKM